MEKLEWHEQGTYGHCPLSPQRINLRNRVERLSEYLGWSQLNGFYTKAREHALGVKWPELAKQSSHNEAFEVSSLASGEAYIIPVFSLDDIGIHTT